MRSSNLIFVRELNSVQKGLKVISLSKSVEFTANIKKKKEMQKKYSKDYSNRMFCKIILSMCN